MNEQLELLTAIRDILTRIEKTMQDLQKEREAPEKPKPSKS
jgi:hypothetical protein